MFFSSLILPQEMRACGFQRKRARSYGKKQKPI